MTDDVLVPFKNDFDYKEQKRKTPATAKLARAQVAAADFETKDGYPHIYTTTQYDTKTKSLIDSNIIFSGTNADPTMFSEMNKKAFGTEGVVFNLKNFLIGNFNISTRVWKQTNKKTKRVKRGKRIPMLFFWNLKYDANSILKTLPSATIDALYTDMTVWVDTLDYSLVNNITYDKLGDKNYKEWNIEGKRLANNRYIKLSYLPKKWLNIEPVNWYHKEGRYSYKVGSLVCWDIMQFYNGGSLDRRAEQYLGENKIDWTKHEKENLLGSMTEAGQAFTIKNGSKLIEYAELDSNLTQRLAWNKVLEFENANVRMIKPYSLASVAERAAYDRANIPTMNKMMKEHHQVVLAAWTAYQGGWFEAVGIGTLSNCSAYDITSAYPHIMWWMPDINKGTWIGSFYGDGDDERINYLKSHKNHNPSFFEAEVIFPEGRSIYPAAKTSEMGCLQNPRIVYGWFTGEEIKEFESWGAEIGIERWCAFSPDTDYTDDDEIGDGEDGIRYPFRPFIECFFTMKDEQTKLRDANDPAYDPAKRQVAKTMICSLYGKTAQAIMDLNIRLRKTGTMWSSVYSATITGATRARLGEFIRLNGYENVASVQTDGIILQGDTHTIPKNHTPCIMQGVRTDLGDWQAEEKGTLTLLMGGVYSITDSKGNSKSTYRGNYALFLDSSDGLKIKYGEKWEEHIKYGANWPDFLKRHRNMELLERSVETDDAYSRPYSLGEAKVRSDYSLVNKFRIINTGIKANGESNKRSWLGTTKPTTFGDIADGWYESSPFERLVQKQ